MKFRPLDQEIKNEFVPLSPGEATFEIKEAEDAISTKGDPMLKLVLKCKDIKGNQGRVWENILGTEMWDWKIRHLLKSIGKFNLYANGDIDPFDLIGSTGKVLLKSKEYQGKLSCVVQDFLFTEVESDIPETDNSPIPF